MAETSLEKRLTAAEARMTALAAEVAQLKQERAAAPLSGKPWWEEIRGTFKNDPAYDEAMRLGREWRKAQQEEYTEDTDA
jgi:hypothetical protein